MRTIWVSERAPTVAKHRELAVPASSVHFVVRVTEDPIRLFDDARAGEPFASGHGLCAGIRSRPYVREVVPGARSVGAQLSPTAAEWLFGIGAQDLASSHDSLIDVWGSDALSLRERLVRAIAPERQLDVIESFLLERLPRLRAVHPAVARALCAFDSGAELRAVVQGLGYSHKHFIELFRRAVGTTPKVYCRLVRFERALAHIGHRSQPDLAAVALDSGFSDQSHLSREFRELCGLSPSAFRKLNGQARAAG